MVIKLIIFFSFISLLQKLIFSSNIFSLKETIEQKETLLKKTGEELERNTKLLQAENEAYDLEQNLWENKSKRLLDEIKTCKEALEILNSDGVRNYVVSSSFN